ncbi:zinc metallopeptidase [Butyrivibrio sp. CB08]|uniref:zinc metallopeptidase n=1 Tax=Butyrivibrio sp. CB08 TaxID=2364879 RepID=UPI000EA85F36|nr:zinc metallopeptidase [Butyrivibrio sp. CB08]RKM61270.1 zinc metallopeptidase [Butyrivibrio sp. CB08]
MNYSSGINVDFLMYILMIVMAVVCMIASFRVKSVYKKFAKVKAGCGLTGAQAALEILRRSGIDDVIVQYVGGDLTDHFDPRNKAVNLSESTYNSASVAAISVAAHECGHVMQHEEGYLPLRIRTAILPMASFGSKAGVPIIILGLFLSFSPLVTVGIWVFSLAVLFQVVTLPVEFDASRRALAVLENTGLLSFEEIGGGKKVLGAAAMTYVASTAAAVVQLMRFVLLNRRRD